MKIDVRFVEHGAQRYNTVGDWTWNWEGPAKEDGTLSVIVSKSGDWRSDVAVAVHELIEGILCVNDGVSQADVDQFDKNFEQAYVESQGTFATDEPGDLPVAPYYTQHGVASVCERLMTNAMSMCWPVHEERLEELMESRRPQEQPANP